MKWFIPVATAILCIVSARPIWSTETVVLTSGRRVRGNVTVQDKTVRVEGAPGTYTIQKSRVARILQQGEAKHPRHPSGDTGKPIDADIRMLLQKKMSISLTGTDIRQVLKSIRDRTNANIVYHGTEVGDLDPISLHLENVALHRILDIVGEKLGLKWGIKDDVIRIGKDVSDSNIVRIYDVRDLLLNVKDHPPASHASWRPDRDDSDSHNDWGEDPGSVYGGEEDGANNQSQPRSLPDRAYNLGLLLTSTVQPEQWDNPPVMIFGGPGGD